MGVEYSEEKRELRKEVRSLKLASAAHELKNPLESIVNLVHLLQQNPTLDEKGRKYIQLMQEELHRMRYITSQVLGEYREPADSSLVSLSDVMDTILRFFSHKIEFKQIEVKKRYECDGLLKARIEDLRQVFSNLIVNALEALRLNGTLSIHIRRSRNWREQTISGIRVIIADNGSGVLPEHRDKIVSHQFFTTKGEKGTGLGLWVTAEVVHKAGGGIHFRSSTRTGRTGTVFAVFLPTEAATDPDRLHSLGQRPAPPS